jgi:hypothetical protein
MSRISSALAKAGADKVKEDTDKKKKRQKFADAISAFSEKSNVKKTDTSGYQAASQKAMQGALERRKRKRVYGR